MCRITDIPTLGILECRFPSPTSGKLFTCYVLGYLEAFKLMRYAIKHGFINDPSEFEFRPVDLEEYL